MSDNVFERVKRLNNISATVSSEPIDHDKLFNREMKDQHPISAITNLQTVIDELKGFNEYIGEIETVEDEQVDLTMFVIQERKRTPRLNDLVRISDRGEVWRHNGDIWVVYSTPHTDIPVASKNVIGGVKIDQEKFTLDEAGYLSYNMANDEAHQNLINKIDELNESLDSKVSASEISEVVSEAMATNGIDDGEI